MQPMCECHDQPAGWQKDTRYKADGYWECRVRRAEYNRRQYAKHGDRIREGHRDWWHKAGGGYIQWRRKELARQRATIESRLLVIEQEAQALESQP